MTKVLHIFRRITHAYSITDNAAESYKFWLSVGYDHDGACAWCGNEEGETDFDQIAVGDHGEAFGLGQDHSDRCANIKAHTGIDLIARVKDKTLTHLDALKAVHWESSQAAGTKHVKNHVMAAKGLQAKVAVIVNEYEFSKNRASDIQKRTAYAEAWSKKFGDQSQ